MSEDYRIERTGGTFIVTDPSGEWVDSYPTEDAARQHVERCKKEDFEKQGAELVNPLSPIALPTRAPRARTRAIESERGYGKGPGSKTIPSASGAPKRARKKQQGKRKKQQKRGRK